LEAKNPISRNKGIDPQVYPFSLRLRKDLAEFLKYVLNGMKHCFRLRKAVFWGGSESRDEVFAIQSLYKKTLIRHIETCRRLATD
jgi:hypothetical protein